MNILAKLTILTAMAVSTSAIAAERVTDKEIELAREKVTLAQTELDTLLAKKEKQDTKTEKRSAKELSDEEQRLVNLFKQKKTDGASADELSEIRKQIALLQAERREQEDTNDSSRVITRSATPEPAPAARSAPKGSWDGKSKPKTPEALADWVCTHYKCSERDRASHKEFIVYMGRRGMSAALDSAISLGHGKGRGTDVGAAMESYGWNPDHYFVDKGK